MDIGRREEIMGMKKSVGNMYPWVDFTHVHLGGECPHGCIYCYVDNPRFGRPEKYQGPLRLLEYEFDVNYGKGNTIFVENCNDMFAFAVNGEFITRILEHCNQYPKNIYVFQTKNPKRYNSFLNQIPQGSILGTTIETNRDIPYIGNAPMPLRRYEAMRDLQFRKFVTIEPILDFDISVFAKWIKEINPEFLNIGADSKGHDLEEPRMSKIISFVNILKANGIEVREKHNLGRLKRKNQ